MEFCQNKNIVMKYKTKKLNKSSSDYSLICLAFKNTNIQRRGFPKIKHIIDIYRIEEVFGSVQKPNKNSLLLFHGTEKQNVSKILKTGFKESKDGCLGNGVYLTQSISIALLYADRACKKGKVFVFVCQVFDSDKMNEVDKIPYSFAKKNNHFEKLSGIIGTSPNNNSKDSFDRTINVGPMIQNKSSATKFFVEEFVVSSKRINPVYLIELILQ